MSYETLIALLIFLFPLAFSPGPGNGFFAALGAAGGLRAAWPALAGYHVATFVVTVAIGLGLGLALLAEPSVVSALRFAGAAYVGWLGIVFLRAARNPDGGGGIERAVRGRFVDGAALLLLNPKAYMIIGLLFTQFLTPQSEPFAAVLALSAVFTLNNLAAFVIWTLAGMALARLLASAGGARAVNGVFAACLIGVAIWMLLG